MAKHTLTWIEGRSTPIVTPVGTKRSKGQGKRVVASRPATAQEESQIASGQWVRSRPPGQPNKRSSIRPHLARKQRDEGRGLWANIRRKKERLKNGGKGRKARPGEKDYPDPVALRAAQGDD